MKRVVITCGLIAGGIVTIMMVIGTSLCAKNPQASQTSMIIGFASMLLAFSLIFVGVKMFRDKYNEGAVTFVQAFLIGLYISLIASTMYVATWAVEYNYVFPDFMEQYAANAIGHAKTSGMSPAKIEATVKEMKRYREMYKNPLLFTLITYWEILPLGIIVSLICALVLKRKNRNDQAVAS